MKKIIVLLMSFLMCFSLLACGQKKPEIKADYETIQDAVSAHRNGVDIVGKTIKVELKEDKKGGIIYSDPDINLRANLYLTLIAEKSKEYEIANLKKGQTVVAKVSMIDDHLGYSIYIFSEEYDIY